MSVFPQIWGSRGHEKVKNQQLDCIHFSYLDTFEGGQEVEKSEDSAAPGSSLYKYNYRKPLDLD